MTETTKTLEELILETPFPVTELVKTTTEQFQDELSEILASERGRVAPLIDNLQDAVVLDEDGDPVFVPEPGEKVVIERFMQTDAGRLWLDTETYRVVSVDHDTGVLRLVNDSLRQSAMSNFILGLKRGYRFKLPGTENVGKRHRGRPKKRRSSNFDEAPVPTKGPPKKRGRPKGSKNRSKETIKIEKAERQRKRQEKRMKREARKRRSGR